MKFGGTSVENAAAMHNVASIVKQHQHRKPFVVISAIAQATNLLTSIGTNAALGNMSVVQENIATFISKHVSIIEEGISSPQTQRRLKETVANVQQDLERLSQGIFFLRELSPRSLDALCVFGEYLSSLCVHEIFLEQEIPGVWLDAKKFMLTDNNFTSASPRLDEVQKRLQNILHNVEKENPIFVTQGFIGATEEGIPTTMGRESSDFTAAVLGSVLNADEIQIWTDVDGFFTADPRVIPTAKLIPHLSYAEALELADRGAKVLHPKTMLPIAEKNLPLLIRNSKNPTSAGTSVSSSRNEFATAVGVTLKNNIAIVSLIPFEQKNFSLLTEILAGILAEHKRTPLFHSAGERAHLFGFEGGKISDSFIQAFREIGSVTLVEKKSLLTIVGNNIFQSPSVVMRFMKSLADTQLHYMTMSAHRLSLAAVVNEEDALRSMVAIHKEFFEQ